MKKLLLIILLSITCYAQQVIDINIYPENYLADGEDDYSIAITNAFYDGAVYGRTVSFQTNKVYPCSNKVAVDLNGKSLVVEGNGAIITSSYAEAGSYGTPIGAVEITDGNTVDITGLTVKATNAGLSPASNYLCALVITSVPKVFIERCKFTNAPYIGLWLVHADKQFAVRDCEVKSCWYAGIGFSSSKNGVIENCEIDTIGYKLPQYGYGITLIKQDEDPRQDENITIRDNHINHCQRKNIDVHNAVNALVVGNQCYGFGYGAIYAVSEWNGTNVRNITIANNDISQDSLWFYGVDATDNPGTYWVGTHPIQVGSTGNLTTYGSFNVTGNFIHDCNSTHPDLSSPYLKYMIHSFTDRAENLIISNNTLENSNPVYGIYLNGSSYGQYDVVSVTGNHFTDILASEIIYLRSGRILNVSNNSMRNCNADDGVKVSGDGAGSSINIVNIDSHPIEGTFATGIWVGTGEFASINDNTGSGTFSSNFLYVESGIDYKAIGNLNNGLQVPDDTTYAYWGKFRNIIMDDPVGSDGIIRNLAGDLELRASGFIHLGYNDGNDGLRYWSGTDLKFSVSNAGIANALGYQVGGTALSTVHLSNFPSIVGHSGYLHTDGSTMEWANVTPSVTWADISSKPAVITNIQDSLNTRLRLSGGSLTGGLSTIGNITLTATDNLIQNTAGDLEFKSAGDFTFGYNQQRDIVLYNNSSAAVRLGYNGYVDAATGYKVNGTTGYITSAFGAKTASGMFISTEQGTVPENQLNYVNLTINGVTYKVLVADP